MAQTDNEKISIMSDFFDKHLPREYSRIRSSLKKFGTPGFDIEKISTKHIIYSDIVNNSELRAMKVFNNSSGFQSWNKDKLDLARKKLKLNLARHHVLNTIDNISQVYFDHKKQGHSLTMCDKAKSYNHKRYGNYKICVSSSTPENIEFHIIIRSNMSWVWHFKRTEKIYALYDIVSDMNEKTVIGLLMLGR